MTGPAAIVIALVFLGWLTLDRWISRRMKAAHPPRPACEPNGGVWHIRLRYRHGNLYEFAVRDPLAAAHCYLIDGRLPEARA